MTALNSVVVGLGNTVNGYTKDLNNINKDTNVFNTVIGTGNVVEGQNATNQGQVFKNVAIGYKNRVATQNSVAMGSEAEVTGISSVAIGDKAKALKGNTLAIGQGATANNQRSMALGVGATTNGDDSIAIAARSGANYSIAMGSSANTGTGATSSIAIGQNATVGAYLPDAVVMGRGATASGNGNKSVAIGSDTSVTVAGGVALGDRSVASIVNGQKGYDPSINANSSSTDKTWNSTYSAVSVGNDSATRQIVNVAAGTKDTDAVNVAQLKSVTLTTIADDKTPANRGDGKVKLATEKIKLTGGAQGEVASTKNIKTRLTSNPNEILIDLVKDVNLGANGSLTTGNTVVNNGGVKVTNGTQSTTLTEGGLTVQNGPTISTTGINMGNDQITNLASGSDGTANGKPTYNTPTNAANIGDVKNITDDAKNVVINNLTAKGLDFAGNTGKVHRDLGQTLNVVGGQSDTTKLSEGANIGVVAAGTGNDASLTIKLAKDVTGLNTVTAGSAVIGNQSGTVINSDGNTSQAPNGSYVTGLSNTSWDVKNPSYVSGRAATEDQLKAVTDALGNQVASKGDVRLVKNPAASDGAYKVTDNKVTLKVQDPNDVANTTQDVVIDDVASATDLNNLNDRAVKYDLNDDKVNKDQVTLEGTNGTQIQNLASGSDGVDTEGNKTYNIDTNAANIGDVKNITNNASEEVIKKGLDFSADSGEKVHRDLGQTLKIEGDGQNITTAADKKDGKITISLKDDIMVGQPGVPGKDGQPGIPGKDGSIGAKGADGSSVVLNGKDGSIGLTGPAGKDGEPGTSITIRGEKGQPGVNGAPGQDGITRIVYQEGETKHEIATLDDGMVYTGDTGSAAVKLNKTVNIAGGQTDTTKLAAGPNIGVVAAQDSENGKLTIQLAKNINLGNDGSVTTGDTVINNGGLTINNGPSVTNTGINAGDKQITDVASGASGKDENNKPVYNTDTNAANIGDVKNITNNASEEVIKKGLDFSADSGEKVHRDLGQTLKIEGDGQNIATTADKDNGKITISLKDDIMVGQPGVPGKDGQPGTPGKDGSIGAKGADGSSVVLNGKDGSIGLTGPAGKDGAPGKTITIKGIDGQPGVDGKDGITRIIVDEREVATLDDGMVYTGDTGSAAVKLNKTVNIAGGQTDATKLAAGPNIGVVAAQDSENGKLTIQLAKDINLGNNGSVTTGDTVINNGGLTINNGPSVTNTGINAGDKQITDVASGASGKDENNKPVYNTDTNAANIGDVKNITNNASEEVIKKGLNFSADSGENVHRNLGETLQIAGDGQNIATTADKDNGKITISLKDDIMVGQPGVPGKDGQPGTPGKDGSIGAKGADGSSVVLNGKDGSIGLTGPAGKDGAPGKTITIKGIDGQPGVDGKDGITRIVVDEREVATLDDGMVYTGDTGSAAVKLNKTVNIAGGQTDATKLAAGPNIGVVAAQDSENGKLTIQLAKDINLGNNGSVTTGDTVINNGGLTIKNGPSVTNTGINAGDKQITDVASGASGKDENNKPVYNTDTNAANIGDVKNITNNASEEVIKKGLDFSADSGENVHRNLGETLKIEGDGQNITTAADKNDGKITISLKDDIMVGQPGVPGKDGQPGIPGKDGSIGAKGADGSSVVLNGKDGSIGLTGPAGKDGAPGKTITIKGIDGQPGVDGKDGITRIVVDEREVATLDDGMVYTGDTGSAAVKLNKTVNIAGGQTDATKLAAGPNIGVVAAQDSENGKLTIQLAKNINLGNDGSVTTGDTVVNNDGVTITRTTPAEGGEAGAEGTKSTTTIGADKIIVNGQDGKDGVDGSGIVIGNQDVTPVITDKDGNTTEGKSESGNYVTGLDNTKWNPTENGIVPDRAATEGQVKEAVDSVTSDVTTKGLNFSADSGENVHRNLGETLQIAGDGQNIATTADKDNGKITISLKDDIMVGQPGVPGKDGQPGIPGKDGSIGAKGADGSSVVLNGKDGSIGLTGPAGKDGAPGKTITIKGIDGQPGVDGKDGITRIVVDEREVATLDDGMVYTGDTGSAAVKLNKTVNIAGGQTDATKLAAGPNIGVVAAQDSENGKLTIQLAKNINLGNDGSVTTGDTVVNNDGVTITRTTPAEGGEAGAEGTKSTTTIGADKIVVNGQDGKDGADGSGIVIGNQDVTPIITNADGTTKDGKSESGNYVTGLDNTKWNPTENGIVPDRAATEGQVKEAVDSVTSDVTTKGLNFSADSGENVHRNLGETLQIAGDGQNIATTADKDNGKITISLKDDIMVGQPGVPGKDGQPGIPGKDGSIGAKGADGSSVVLNGKDGSIGLTGPAGKDGAPGKTITIKGIDGQPGVDGKDGITRIVVDEREVATLDDGMVYTGDTGSAAVKLNKTVNIAGGQTDATKLAAGPNIGVVAAQDSENGKLTIQLAKNINLGNDGSVTTGDTVVNNDGVTITRTTPAEGGEAGAEGTKNTTTIGADKIVVNGQDGKDGADGSGIVIGNQDVTPIITNADGTIKEGKSESGNYVTGLDNTKWNPTENGIVPDRAATEGQVKEAVDSVTSDVTTKGLNFTDDKGTEVHRDLGETLQIAGDGQNIATVADPTTGKITVGLTSDLSIGGPAGQDGKDGVDGKIGINGADGKSGVGINGKDGISIKGADGKDGVTISAQNGKDGKDGSEGHIGLTGVPGKDGESTYADIHVVEGQPGVNGVDGKDGLTRIVYEDKGGTTHQVATLDDGQKYAGDNGQPNAEGETDASKVIKKKLNEQLDIIGGADSTKLTDNNIGVNNVDGKLKVQLAKDINLGKDGSVTTGDTVINNGGLTINNGPSVTSTGINAGDKQITDVASGASGKDENNKPVYNTDTNAANIGDVKNITNNASEEVIKKGLDFSADSGENVHRNLGETLKIEGDGQNIATVADSTTGKITVGLTNDLTIGGPGKDGKDGVDGKIGVNGKDGQSGVSINGADGSIGLTGPAGKDGAPGTSITIRGEKGQPGVNGTPGQDGITRIVYQEGETKHEVATLDDGMVYTGDTGSAAVKLNKTVNIAGGQTDATKLAAGPNIGVVAAQDSENGKLTIQLAKNINLGNDGSVTTGDTVVNNDGVTITRTTPAEGGEAGAEGTKSTTTIGADKIVVNGQDGKDGADGSGIVIGNQDVTPIITNADGTTKDGKSESGNYVTGLDNTKWNPTENGIVPDRAATEGQVKEAVDSVTSDVTTKGLNFSADSGENVHRNLGETLQIAGDGQNIATVADPTTGKITVGLTNDLSIGGPAGQDGKDGVDGKIGINGADGKSGVGINGKDGISIKGADGKDGVTISAQNGKDGKDAPEGHIGLTGAPGKDGLTRIVYEDKGGTTHEVATLDDGQKYAGDNGQTDATQVIKKKLNEQLDIIGGADPTKLSDNNIGVNNVDGKLKVQLAKDINLGKDGSVTTGDTVVNNDGVTITRTTPAEGGEAGAEGTKNTTTIGADKIVVNGQDGKDGADGSGIIIGNQDVTPIITNSDGTTKDGKSESGNYVTGLDNTKWNPTENGIVPDRAATEGQVKEAVDSVTSDVTTKGLNFTDDKGTEVHRNLGETLQIAGDGQNIATVADPTTGKITVGLTNDLSIGGPAGQDGKDGVDGKIGINGADGKSGVGINGKDGISIKGADGKDGVTISAQNGKDGKDGSEGHIGLTGAPGKDGESTYADIHVVEGQPGVNGTPGKDGLTRIVYEDKGGTTHEVATLDDGQKYAGDNGQTDATQVIKKKLNEQLDIIGGADPTKLSDNNIGVNNVDGKLKVQLANEITLGGYEKGDSKITVGGDNGGAVIIDGGNRSITFQDPTNGDRAPINVTVIQTADNESVGGERNSGNTRLTVGGADGVDYVAYTSDGYDYHGDIGKAAVGLNSVVSVTGGIEKEDELATDPNIGVIATPVHGEDGDTAKLELRLAKDLKGLNSAEFGTVIIGNQEATPVKTDGSKGNPETGNFVTGLSNTEWKPNEKGIVSGRAATEDQLKAATDSITDYTKGGGFGLADQSGEEVKKNLGETITVKGGITEDTASESEANGVSNITTKVNNGALEISLNKDIDLGKNGSITVGETTIDKGGITTNNVTADKVKAGEVEAGSVKTDTITVGDTITINQDGINAGKKQIKDLASGASGTDENNKPVYNTDTNAANIGDVKNITKSANEETVSKGLNFTDDKGVEVHRDLGQTLQIAGDGQNITTTADPESGKITVGLGSEIMAGEPGKDGKDGSIGATGKDGASVVLNGKDGSIGLTGPAGADGKPGETITIKGAKGQPGVDGKDGISRIIVDNHEVATLDDGMVYAGDTGTAAVKLNKTVNITGGEKDAAKLSDGANIGVVASQAGDNGQLTIKLAKDLTNLNSVTTGDVNGNHTAITGDGITISDGPTFTREQIDAAGNKITSVADGDIAPGSKDAVNGGQLFDAFSNVGGAINKLGNRINRVGAGAAALAALHPLDFDPDEKWDFAGGYGNYRGANAVAVGAFYRPNEDTMFSLGGSFGGGENMVNAGVSFKVGQGNHVSTSRVAMAKELKDLRQEVEQLRSALVDVAAGNKLDPTKTKLFPDVPKNHWAYNELAILAGNGIVEGYPDGNFAGDRMMTRYEFAMIVYRQMQKGAEISERLFNEFEPELERIRVDVVAKDKDGNPTIERVRVIPGRG